MGCRDPWPWPRTPGVLHSGTPHICSSPCTIFPCTRSSALFPSEEHVKEIDLWRKAIWRGYFQRNYFKAVLPVHHILTFGIFSIIHDRANDFLLQIIMIQTTAVFILLIATKSCTHTHIYNTHINSYLIFIHEKYFQSKQL